MENATNCKVSVIIKALNEEQSIARAIESALQAVEAFGGEVILADSLSTDETVSIAKNYPIKIVQLTNPGERCCGVGPQLGYQYAAGEYVYILDGDMQMLDGFLAKAVEFLDENTDYGGVGGKVLEMNTEGLEFQARVEREPEDMKPGDVVRLDMGGLYRKSAIESVGYFSNRNLHACEELDLAVRLRSRGWKLHRIDVDSVKHWGHDVPSYQLVWRRWKSGYSMGLGEAIRGAIGQPHFKLLLRDANEIKPYSVVIMWWFSLIAVLVLPFGLSTKLTLFMVLFSAPFVVMTIKKKSLNKALYSIVALNFYSAGMLRGGLRRHLPEREAISSRVLSNPIEVSDDSPAAAIGHTASPKQPWV